MNVVSIRKLHVRESLLCLPYFLDILSMDVITTSHWQTSCWLVQESNVRTVHTGNHNGNVIRDNHSYAVQTFN